MKRIAGRTLYTLLVLFLASVAVFYAIRLSGGDATAARLVASATAEDREAFRELLGLNEPIHQQDFKYMGRLLSGDLGVSLTNSSDIFKMLNFQDRKSTRLNSKHKRTSYARLCLKKKKLI